MATNPNHEFAHIERQHRRLRECIAEVKRLNKMARRLLKKYHEMKQREPKRVGTELPAGCFSSLRAGHPTPRGQFARKKEKRSRGPYPGAAFLLLSCPERVSGLLHPECNVMSALGEKPTLRTRRPSRSAFKWCASPAFVPARPEGFHRRPLLQRRFGPRLA